MDFGTIFYGQLVRKDLVLCNRGKAARKCTSLFFSASCFPHVHACSYALAFVGLIDAVPELRDHVEFIPKLGFVQAAVKDAAAQTSTPSEFKFAVKLTPSEALKTQCGK